MSSVAAIVLAAGKGTRMKSSRAKVTFPLADKPMLQRVVDTAVKLDCSKIAVVVGFQKESVIACLEEDERLEFVEQTEQLGTGHAVSICEPSFQDFDGDIIILCGDVPLLRAETIRELYSQHIGSGAVCTVLTAVLEDAGRYGRILRDQDGKVCGIVEYKDATEAQRAIGEFNTGIYVFNSRELFRVLKLTSNTNQQGEYYLTDCLGLFYKEGKTVSSVVLEDLMEVAGVNSQEQLAELEDVYLDRIRKHWLNNGVVMHNPASIHIGDEVTIEQDVEIDAGTIIKGHTEIERDVKIGPNCLIIDSKIAQDSILRGYNVLINAIVHEAEELDYMLCHEDEAFTE
ncbi:MAG TPA: NTP transferase domain-containing protein [Candidatus Cloacimonadota bacterium]|nr:NTP transferase domain-containing protein [Candidatus Cloacimonadota bacterium]